MDWYTIGLIGFIGLVIFIVGTLLIVIDHKLEQKRSEEHDFFITNEIIPEVRKVVIHVLGQGMDLIPEKLKDIREQMEREQ